MRRHAYVMFDGQYVYQRGKGKGHNTTSSNKVLEYYCVILLCWSNVGAIFRNSTNAKIVNEGRNLSDIAVCAVYMCMCPRTWASEELQVRRCYSQRAMLLQQKRACPSKDVSKRRRNSRAVSGEKMGSALVNTFISETARKKGETGGKAPSCRSKLVRLQQYTQKHGSPPFFRRSHQEPTP